MILTCPNCATRFFADDGAFGAAGRRVKCDACGEVWTAVSHAVAPASETGSQYPSDGEADADVVVVVVNNEAAAPVEAAPLFVDRGARARVAPPTGNPRMLGLVILLFVVVAGLLIFQRAIERSFPGATTFYQSLGLKGARAPVG